MVAWAAGRRRAGGMWWSLGATTASRAESSSPVEAVPAAAAAVAAAAAAPAAPEPVQMDPFRPVRAAVDPVVINILVKILSSGEDAERVANKAVRKRMRNPETVRLLCFFGSPCCARVCVCLFVRAPVVLYHLSSTSSHLSSSFYQELTAEERRLIYKRVYGVEVLRGRLSFLLEHAVKVRWTDGRVTPNQTRGLWR